jgi:hypothetical protein
MLQGLGTQSLVMLNNRSTYITSDGKPELLLHCAEDHPYCETGARISVSITHAVGRVNTYTSNTQPNQVELGSLTPCPGEPNFAYARKIWVTIEPNLPAAALNPWQVHLYFVGNTSAEICMIELELGVNP